MIDSSGNVYGKARVATANRPGLPVATFVGEGDLISMLTQDNTNTARQATLANPWQQNVRDAQREFYREQNPEAADLGNAEVDALVQADIRKRQVECEEAERAIIIRELHERNAKILDARPRMYRNAVADHPAVVEWTHSLAKLTTPGTRDLYAQRRGNGLLMYGATGSGKTHQGLGIPALLDQLDQSASHLFIRAVDYLDGQQNADFGDKERLYRQACNAHLLILDDLFAGGDHKRSASDLYRLLDARHIDERPTILTTNLVGRPLTDALGERLVDRLKQSAVMVKIDGGSRRQFQSLAA